jgi:hypothetical protein
MKRERNNDVTSLPILIPAVRREKREGFTIFGPVRTLGTNDMRDAVSVFRVHEAKHFYGVTMLGKALGERPDSLAIKRAVELIREAYALKIKADESDGTAFAPFPEPENPEQERMEFAHALSDLRSLTPTQTKSALLSKKSQATNPRWLLSNEVSSAIGAARLVLWWTGHAFKAAIWCPERKTAFYACALFGMLHICPHCSQPFLPKRPDQDYCSVAHREAHRVARWRAGKNLKHKIERRGEK